MSVIIRTVSPALGGYDEKEIRRYMGAGYSNGEFDALIGSCIDEAESRLSSRACYAIFDIAVRDGAVDFGFATVESKALAKNLCGCERAVIFGATVGIGLDRLIALYGRTEPARALCLQALGAERIEALCDALQESIRAEGITLRPRFSPGYGDLPLEFQRDIFRVLDCPRRIGLTLGDSLLMSPTKSVTAIVGIGKEE